MTVVGGTTLLTITGGGNEQRPRWKVEGDGRKAINSTREEGERAPRHYTGNNKVQECVLL